MEWVPRLQIIYSVSQQCKVEWKVDYRWAKTLDPNIHRHRSDSVLDLDPSFVIRSHLYNRANQNPGSEYPSKSGSGFEFIQCVIFWAFLCPCRMEGQPWDSGSNLLQIPPGLLNCMVSFLGVETKRQYRFSSVGHEEKWWTNFQRFDVSAWIRPKRWKLQNGQQISNDMGLS